MSFLNYKETSYLFIPENELLHMLDIKKIN